ncbi:ABC transporter ATP-binding protein [Acetobacterium carbinolicum]|jgi:ABC-2 type transport system ATP-binding protein|uniref:ABC transporter ATP-binding protein n=1 Tax=Acetobacterium TaxID=33951 RepID=UPI000DBEBE71|nr:MULTISPECIES: ABC transporter ATP-binding protein [unclassified Acetobacterium]AWW27051.1 ABC transporter ATP-binding protein [Acetobacterium sp. KB-1]MDK2942770.1 type transport system ATP-binding protein [Acetobacterium sp.]MDZ5724245.1 ABC transporter ATP-binding protein [Acetobacterium sp. K1/6]
MLSIKDVSMTYQKGKKEALKNINLEILEGEFTALLGQNGAGKSTLINILAGNVKKTRGDVSIGGYSLDRNELETKKIIGIVPQDTGYDFVFTVDEALKKQSGYFGIKDNKEYIDEVLDALYLTEKRSARIRDLSGGMRRRFLIAKALVHKPKILILDEPTAGVDIEMRHTLYDFLVKLHESGTTIILTTHYIEEAEKLCKRIVIIDGGKIIADEPKEELMDAFSRESIIEVHFEDELSLADFDFLSDYHPHIEDKTRLQLKASKKDLSKVFRQLSEKNMEFTNLVVERPKLEDIYLNIIKH